MENEFDYNPNDIAYGTASCTEFNDFINALCIHRPREQRDCIRSSRKALWESWKYYCEDE